MRIEKLSLQHQGLLQGRLKRAGTFLSEFCFANLYLFREAHDYQVIMTNDDIYLSGKTYDGHHYVMPTVSPGATNLKQLEAVARDYDFVFPVDEAWRDVFGPAGSAAKFAEGDSDYIYTVEKLSTYKGQKLHSKKNLLNQFLSMYTPDAKPLTHDRMADALNILDEWQVDVGEPKQVTDYFPCREAFKLYDQLILCGGIYYVSGEPAGFIIGEELNHTMFVLHFAKGKRKFKGIYQYMYNHFANILPQKYEFLNFEQDLGKLALKIAKSSYHPDRIMHKYRVRIGK